MLNIKNTTDGYLKDVEIKGNTYQNAENLADIRSVGDKVEGQELYEIPVVSSGKNLFKINEFELGAIGSNGEDITHTEVMRSGFIPITSSFYTCSLDGQETSFNRYLYDKDKILVGVNSGSAPFNPVLQNQNTKYVRFTKTSIEINANWQLEESTQVTPYEPYVEEKLTILSPVQLELGDRIYRDDIEQTWCVEKYRYKLSHKYLHTPISGNNNDTMSTYMVRFRFADIGFNSSTFKSAENNISNVVPTLRTGIWSTDVEGVCVTDTTYLDVRINKNKLSDLTPKGALQYLQDNKFYVLLHLVTPQKINLPHDQQVKLRTFAGQTNISFLTEIEGTIKAQVPKSIGASINTHTEQIANLSNELTRVKKLEESTVSTVETESNFTTVEETSNGYFEDVKLEGKTLVNLCPEIKSRYNNCNIETSKGFTVISKCLLSDWSDRLLVKVIKNDDSVAYLKMLSDGTNDTVYYLKDIKRIEQVYFDPIAPSDFSKFKVIILEGDHTQNPPEYFEGLKSVGQSATTSEDGVDEISVESVDGDGNLLNSKYKEEYLTTQVTANIFDGEYVWLGKGEYCVSQMAKGYVGERYVYVLYDEAGNRILSSVVRTTQDEQLISAKLTISNSGLYKIVPSPHNGTSNAIWCKQFMINKGTTPKPYTPHQSNKKPLLYYNPTTQTWEKPVLREWDSIEKHADGKYYYHQRSGEVVLDDNVNVTNAIKNNNTTQFNISVMDFNDTRQTVISDKFSTGEAYGADIDYECISNYSSSVLVVKILNSRLSTQDAQGFKAWLQANPITVVYQLAQEEVYECTNIDLITYANETNYIVNSGAISPKSILKVHSNISNVVKILQEKVSLLENNVKASQEVQDMMILESDMRILDMELALMEYMPVTLNLGGDIMFRSATYFNFLKNHIENETYEKEYLENVMNKYLATNRLTQEEYDELYKLLYPPVYDIELPIEY